MEENKRKQVIQELGRSSANENLDIYFRRPVDIQKDKSDHRISTSADNTQNIYVTAQDSGPHSITSTFRRSPSRRDKIEIDSDNIETPPVTRKLLAATDKDLDRVDGDGETLGNGQFDRFSSARKTRRYKRPTLGNTSSDVDQSTAVTPEPTEKNTSKVYIEPKSPPPVVLEQKLMSPSLEDKESRLKRWQEKLKSLDDHSSIIDSPTPTNTTSRSSSRKTIATSGVNPAEVNDAVHYLQRQTSKSTNKTINLELNDEGFEESQSLVSDTPSQGRDNNSGTETNEAVSGSGEPVKRMNSSESAQTSTSNEGKSKPTPKGRSLTPSRHLTTRTQSLRSASATRSSAGIPCNRPNLPIRRNSLKKNDSDSRLVAGQPVKPVPVQKSNSRNSLLSSRSSLNSAVSTNTVKKAPTLGISGRIGGGDFVAKKLGGSSIASRLTPGTSTSDSKPSIGAPIKSASTSSTSLSSMRSNNVASASAVAQQLRDQIKRPIANTNSVNTRLSVSQAQSPVSKVPLSSTNSINPQANNNKGPLNPSSSAPKANPPSAALTRKGSSGSNFMRPTASSVTKSSPSVTIGASSAAQKPSRFR